MTTKSVVALSKRQQQCVTYLLKGKSIKEIAAILNLSPRTIEFYLGNIREKFGCKNKTELILALINN